MIGVVKPTCDACLLVVMTVTAIQTSFRASSVQSASKRAAALEAAQAAAAAAEEGEEAQVQGNIGASN